ncbi:MAG: hypothetical protein JNL60_08845 [Bacteroidia bacterium]|nr:hypothetical protein [Bacteroidia bacterium]
MSQGEIIGSIGVTLLLIAFTLNLVNKLGATSKTYLLLNIVGAGLACLSSYLIAFWPFVILEGVWTLSSFVIFIRTLRS